MNRRLFFGKIARALIGGAAVAAPPAWVSWSTWPWSRTGVTIRTPAQQAELQTIQLCLDGKILTQSVIDNIINDIRRGS